MVCKFKGEKETVLTDSRTNVLYIRSFLHVFLLLLEHVVQILDLLFFFYFFLQIIPYALSLIVSFIHLFIINNLFVCFVLQNKFIAYFHRYCYLYLYILKTIICSLHFILHNDTLGDYIVIFLIIGFSAYKIYSILHIVHLFSYHGLVK